MAISPQLLQFKSSGVYRLEFDKSQTSNINVETLRLMAGHSKKGPYNTPVLVENVEDFETIYGSIDSNLENKGMFFHRSCKTALSRGPVLCLNLNNFTAADKSFYASPGTDGSKGAGQISVSATGQKNYTAFHDTDKFMTPKDSKVLTELATGDDNVFHFVNIKKTPVSIIVRQAANKTGFELTAEEWYGTGNVPAYLNAKDYMADFMVDVLIFKGKYDAAVLATDPVLGQYFNVDGLDKSKLDAFTNERQVSLIGSYSGSVLPGFKDLNGTELYIESMINAEASKTGVFCAIDESRVIDITGTKIDLVGHSNTATSYEVLSHKITPTTVFAMNSYNDDSVFADTGAGFTLTFDVATPNIDLYNASTQLYLKNDSGVFVAITASSNVANTVWTITHNSTITSKPTQFWIRTTYDYTDGSTYASPVSGLAYKATLTFAVDTPNVNIVAGSYIADSSGYHQLVSSVVYTNNAGAGPFVHTISLNDATAVLPASLANVYTYTPVSYNDGGIYAYDGDSTFTLTFSKYTPNCGITTSHFIKDTGLHYVGVTSVTVDAAKLVWTIVTAASAASGHTLSLTTPPSQIWLNTTIAYIDGATYTSTTGDDWFILKFPSNMVSQANVNLQVGDDIKDAAGVFQRITAVQDNLYQSGPDTHSFKFTCANASNLVVGADIVPPFANDATQPERHAAYPWSMNGVYARTSATTFTYSYQYDTGYTLDANNEIEQFPIKTTSSIVNTAADLVDITSIVYSNANGLQAIGPYVYTVTVTNPNSLATNVPTTAVTTYYNLTSTIYDDNGTMSTAVSGVFDLTYTWPVTTAPLSVGDYIPDVNGDPIKVLVVGPATASGTGTKFTITCDNTGATEPLQDFAHKYTLAAATWAGGSVYSDALVAQHKFSLSFYEDVTTVGTTASVWSAADYFLLDSANPKNLQYAAWTNGSYTAGTNGVADNTHVITLENINNAAADFVPAAKPTNTYSKVLTQFHDVAQYTGGTNAASNLDILNGGVWKNPLSPTLETVTFDIEYTNTTTSTDPYPNNWGYGTGTPGIAQNGKYHSTGQSAAFFIKDNSTKIIPAATITTDDRQQHLDYIGESYLMIKGISTVVGASKTTKTFTLDRGTSSVVYPGANQGMNGSGLTKSKDLFGNDTRAVQAVRDSLMGYDNTGAIATRDDVYALDWHSVDSTGSGIWMRLSGHNYYNPLIGTTNFTDTMYNNVATMKTSFNGLNLATTSTAASVGYLAVPLVEIGTKYTAASQSYALNANVYHGANLYQVVSATATAAVSTAPTHTKGVIVIDAISFKYVGRPMTATVALNSTNFDYFTITDHGEGYYYNIADGATTANRAAGVFTGGVVQTVKVLPQGAGSGRWSDLLSVATAYSQNVSQVSNNGKLYTVTNAPGTVTPSTAAGPVHSTGTVTIDGIAFLYVGPSIEATTVADAVNFTDAVVGDEKSEYKIRMAWANALTVESMEQEFLGAMLYTDTGRFARITKVEANEHGNTGVIRDNGAGTLKVYDLYITAAEDWLGNTSTTFSATQIGGLYNRGAGTHLGADVFVAGSVALGWDAVASVVPTQANVTYVLGQLVTNGTQVYEVTTAGASNATGPVGTVLGVAETVNACGFTNRGTGTKTPFNFASSTHQNILFYQRFNSVGWFNGGKLASYNANNDLQTTWSEFNSQNHFNLATPAHLTDVAGDLFKVTPTSAVAVATDAGNLPGSYSANPYDITDGHSRRLASSSIAAGNGTTKCSIYRQLYNTNTNSVLLANYDEFNIFNASAYSDAPTLSGGTTAGQFQLTWNHPHGAAIAFVPNVNTGPTAADDGSYLLDAGTTTHAQVTTTVYDAATRTWTIQTDSTNMSLPIPTNIYTWSDATYYDGSYFNSGPGNGTFSLTWPDNRADALWADAVNGGTNASGYTAGYYLIDNVGEYCMINQTVGGAATNAGRTWTFMTDKATASFTNIGPTVAGTSILTAIETGISSSFNDGCTFLPGTNALTQFKLSFPNKINNLGSLGVTSAILAAGGGNADHREVTAISVPTFVGSGPYIYELTTAITTNPYAVMPNWGAGETITQYYAHAHHPYENGSKYLHTAGTDNFTLKFDKPYPNLELSVGDVLAGTVGWNTITSIIPGGSPMNTEYAFLTANIGGGTLPNTKPVNKYTRTAQSYEDESTYTPNVYWNGTSVSAMANSFTLEFDIATPVDAATNLFEPLKVNDYLKNTGTGELIQITAVNGPYTNPSTGIQGIYSFTTAATLGLPATWNNMGIGNTPVRNKYTQANFTYTDDSTYNYSGSGNVFTLTFPATTTLNTTLAITDAHFVLDSSGTNYADVLSVSNALAGSNNVFTITLDSPPLWANDAAWDADTAHYASYASTPYTDGSTYQTPSILGGANKFSLVYPMQMSNLQFSIGDFVKDSSGMYHIITAIDGLSVNGTWGTSSGWDAAANSGNGYHTIEVTCEVANQSTGLTTGVPSSGLSGSFPAYYVGTVESSREVEFNPTMSYAASGSSFTMTFSSAPSSFPIAKGHYVTSTTANRLALVKQVAKSTSGSNTIYTITCDIDVQTTWPAGNGFYIKSYEAATTHYKMFLLDAAIIAQNTLSECINQLSGTGLASALVDKDQIDFRYIVDTFGSFDTANGINNKSILSTLAKTRGNASALLNAPMVEEFKKSTNPSFLNPLLSNKFETNYIKDGGNLALNPTNLYALPSITDGANYAFYYAPGLNVKLNGVTKAIPPAAYISNNFIDKYTTALPWSIVAGPRRGVVGGSGVVGVEYAFDKDDRDVLEPFGINPIVFVRGAGLTILGNKTAQQSIQSALSSAHVREVLIYIQDGIADILKDYVFEFNTVQTRLEIKTLCDGFMEGVKQDSGVYDFKNIMDSTNNTVDVIDANMGIVDTYVEPVKGLEIVVHRTTVLNTGEIQSGSF